MNTIRTAKPLWLACMLALATSASAETFTLGEVDVTAPGLDTLSGTTTTVDQEEMRTFNRETVGKAINVLPGVTATEGGPRNEQMITVRGFDLREVPVFVDGIPVYVSYDGYVDLGRFNTFDLAAIDVSKGFSSVLYGPNALGGAINLVSRKPTKELEGDVTAGVYLNRNLASNGYHTDVNGGGNHGTWYWQASASYLNKNQYQLSGDFSPTKNEDGGNRDNSYNRDKKLNLKFGWTPQVGDEYTINYINQQGEKGTPVYTGTDPSAAVRFWQWPYWDKESLYLISRTGIGNDSYLKVRAYYDKFQNSIKNFTNATYTVLGSKPFLQSWYDDYSYGASAEFGTKVTNDNTLKLAAHFKDDIHREHNQGNPVQHFRDLTSSYGVEDTQRLIDKLDLVAGVSRDTRDTKQAQNYVAGNIVDFPKDNTSAWNPQVGLFYRASATDEVHATVSRKSRFPTIKDRYSYRLGTAIPNASLSPEKSTNYEIGASGVVAKATRLSAAVFYYDIQDMMQTVTVPSTQCGGATCLQMQNIGKVQTKGMELGILNTLTEAIEVGANITLLSRRNVSNPSIILTDVPKRKLFAYTKWQATAPLSVIASLEADSSRFSNSNGKFVAGGFGVANLKGTYQFNPAWSAEVGVNNLLDRNYMLVEGYPLEGRNYFANATMKF